MRFGTGLWRGPAALVVAFLALGATCEEGSDIPSENLFTVKGRLTNDGIECPTLRSSDGQIYTLAGSLGDYRAGDRVCVKGRRVDASHCMQGITITVEWIGLSRWCP
jgi:hypothetical protein